MPSRSGAHRLHEHPDAPLQVGIELTPAHAQLEAMAVAMESHHVPLGSDLRRELRAPLRLFADQEENRPHRLALENLKHRRRPLGMGTVVEGQRDATGVRQRPPQTQRPGGPRIDRGQQPERRARKPGFTSGQHRQMIDNRRVAPQLDAWLGDPAVRVAHRQPSTAAPEDLWEAAQRIQLSDTRMLGRLIRWRIPGVPATTRFAALFREPPFAVLDEGELALVSGLVGRIWTLRRDYPALGDPEEFRAWSSPGTAKVVFGHWVEADGATGSVLRSETRVKAFGPQGRLGLASIRPLITGFQHLVSTDALAGAVRRAEGR